MTWIKTIDQQPEIYKDVLVFIPISSACSVECYQHMKGNNPLDYENYVWSEGFYVSHWMPLPEDPK